MSENSSSMNLYLWAIGASKRYKLTNTKIYGVKIYRNNILEADLIPVVDLDDTICMYDKVSNRFLYNAGTGNFIAGTYIENPYVTDGLISMWDAEFNCFEGLHQTNWCIYLPYRHHLLHSFLEHW